MFLGGGRVRTDIGMGADMAESFPLPLWEGVWGRGLRKAKLQRHRLPPTDPSP